MAVPAGFLKWVWRESVSHKSQPEQLLVSKLRQREGSTTVPHSGDTCLAGHCGSQQWQEGAEWASSEWQLSWCGVLGKERGNNTHLVVLCYALHCCALSLCWQCQFSNSLVSSLYMESLEGDDFFSSFFFYLSFFFTLPFFPMQSSLFLPLIIFFFLWMFYIFVSLLKHFSR